MVTAITGPVLFNIYPTLPFLIAAALSIIWTVVLTLAFRSRERTVNAIVQKEIISKHAHASCVFKIMKYPLLEILAQMIEAKHDYDHFEEGEESEKGAKANEI